ncbi:LysR substrate-binding domain-containing protein [Nocardioides pyridinolyticus]
MSVGAGTGAWGEGAITVPGWASPARSESHLDLASTAAVKAAAATGGAPAVLSNLAVASELASGSLVTIPVEDLDLTRWLRAVWPARSRLAGPPSDLVRLASGRKPRPDGSSRAASQRE